MKNLFFILILCMFKFSHALELKDVRIVDEGSYDCGLSKDSIESSVLSAARYNRLPINSKSFVYVKHSVLPLEIRGGCAVNLNIKFGFFGVSQIPGYEKQIFTDVVLCERSSILSGPLYDLQVRVNDGFKKYFDSCLAEINKTH